MDRQLPTHPTICLDDGLVHVHMVQITPSRVYFCGPEVSLSNRVLLNYPEDIDIFLRVSFVDEDLDKLHSTVSSPRASSANEDDRGRCGGMHEVHKAESLRLERERLGLLNTDMQIQIRVYI